MKHRPLSLLILTSMLLVFIMSGILSSLSPLLGMPKAAAVFMNDYAFDTPKDAPSLGALKKAIEGNDPGSAAFGQTVVYVRNQVFDKNAFPLNYDQRRTDCAHASRADLSGCGKTVINTGSGFGFSGTHFGGLADDVYVYTGTYTCLPDKPQAERFVAGGNGGGDNKNWVVNFSVTLKMDSTGQYSIFDGGGKIKRYAWIHWMGFGDNNNPGIHYTDATQPGSAPPATQEKSIKDLPPICHPPDVPGGVLSSGSNNTEESDAGIINKEIPILASLDTPQSTKDEWTKAHVTSGSGVSGLGANSTPTLGCNFGFSSVGAVFESLNPLNWLLCGVIKGMVGIIGVLDNAINSQLSVGSKGNSSTPSQIFCDQGICNAYHEAWSSFRNIALGLLVIGGLIIIISQAVGMELLDAYTIRKMLPRLLIAALAITLSWQLMEFFVTLTNDIGYGIRQLIYFPFTRPGSGLSSNIKNLGGGTGAATGLLAGIGLAAFDFFGLLAFAGTAALAVFVAFLFLILRQVLIILLLILAPVAILAYVLPNTQRAYKLWWESFSKALLMFPIIAGMIAAGRVFSIIAISQGSDFLHQAIAFLAYFAPYFMIPATFKLAGGALSALGGAVNKASQGGFGALKNFRGGRVKKNMQALKDGTRLSGTKYEGAVMGKYSKFARQFNRATKGATNLPNAGYDPRQWGNRMRAAKATNDEAAANEAREKNLAVKALEGDDDLIHIAIEASLGNHGDNWTREQLAKREYENLDEGVALIHRARTSGVNQQVLEAALIPMLFGSKSGLTPKYKTNDKGERVKDGAGNDIIISGDDNGAGVGREMITRIARGDGQKVIRLLGQARGEAERTGRWDLLGGSYTEDLANTQALARHRLSSEEVTEKTLDGALDGMSRGRIMSGHKRAVVALSQRMKVRTRNAAVVQGGVERADQGQDAISMYASLGATVDAASSSAPEMIGIVKDEVLDDVVQVGTLPKLVLDELGPAKYNFVEEFDRDPNGALITDPQNGKPKTFRRPVLKTSMTNAEVKEGLEKNSAEYGRYKREYSRGSDAYAASHSGAPDPGATGGGTGGTP